MNDADAQHPHHLSQEGAPVVFPSHLQAGKPKETLVRHGIRAEADDGAVQADEHRELPWEPESSAREARE